MHQNSSFSRRTSTPLALLVSLVAAGCGSQSEISAEGEVENQKFPFVLEDGAVACGPGRFEGQALEYYFFDKLNARLETSPALAALAARRGVTVVDSCATARGVGQAMAELIRNDDPVNHPSERTPELISAEDSTDLPGEDPPVHAIADGITTTHPAVVKIYTATGMCSGALISHDWLVSAAHCFAGNGTFSNISVYNRDGYRIDNGTVQVVRDPYWTGDVSDGDDIALVYTNAWKWPANSSAAWLKVFGRQLYKNAQVTIWGYGGMNHAGDGAGVLRRSAKTLTADYSSANWLGFDTNTGEGRICKGDSGGPAITATGLLGGVASHHESGWTQDPSYHCPTPGFRFYYTQVGAGSMMNCATGGRGERRSCWIQDTINNKYATTDPCRRYAVSDYSYLQCF